MQVFTRCFNYCNRSWLWTASKTRGVRSHDAIPHGKQGQQPNTKKQHKQTKTGKPAKNTKTKQPTQPGRGIMASQHYLWDVVTRQLMCPVLSRSSIEATEGQSHQNHRMNRQVPSKKSRNAETRDPPSQDPGDRKARPCRHDKHQCTSITSMCRACEKMRVKRQWTDSKTYRVKKPLSVRPPLRVLSCVLWRSS